MHYSLRVASAMCFIGHGAFGIITKPIWCNYFAVFGIGHDLAYRLMPILGSVDILLGCMLLFYPIRALFAWLALWGLVTASLRPLSGEPFAELIERAGNFGAPLCLLLLSGVTKNRADWLRPIHPGASVSRSAFRKATLGLRLTGFLLLAGHGWLNLLQKKALIAQYSTLGFPHPVTLANIVGAWEITGAILLLLRPSRTLLAILLLWKASSELLYPHYELFEWIERGGSYGVLLALWFSCKRHKRSSSARTFA